MKVFLVILTLLAGTFASIESDRILKDLPGCSHWNFKAYSGYIPVDDHNKYHYVFVESQNTPETDPLIVIFSGGPGCSSMNTFFQENGPCLFYGLDSNPLPHDNEYSWNKFANTLYIESPAGVGFNLGYQGEENTDDRSALLHQQFLVNWFKSYPEFISNDLYLNGESYVGVYAPTLAVLLHQNRLTTSSGGYINLRGVIVGNPMTSWEYDSNPAFIELAWYHGLIPLSLKMKISTNKCNFRDLNPEPLSVECQEALDLFEQYTKGINPLDIYRPFGDGFSNMDPSMPKEHLATLSALGNSYSTYLNREDIKLILNIPKEITYFNLCSNVNYTYSEKASFYAYPLLKDYGYKILIYSGDTDGVVPTVGTWKWIKDLNWPRLSDQKSVIRNNTVVGFMHQYDGMDFFVVHGAGHLVPIWKKELSLELIQTWIKGQTLA